MIAVAIAGSIALFWTLVTTPLLIRYFQSSGYGQPIGQYAPSGHATKAGTPTMGGVVVVVGAGLGYSVAHVRGTSIFTWGGLAVMIAIVGAALVGVVDDVIKLRYARNRGLGKASKTLGLIVVGLGFSLLAHHKAGVSTEVSFTRTGVLGVDLGFRLWTAWAIVVILGSSNAVNLTDGLDGLAAGCSAMGFAAYAGISFWSFRHFSIYHTPQALDLAIISGAMVGGIAGFLWWNAPPARVFMGDAGSLSLGAGLAVLALSTNTVLLLPIVGAVFVIETLSVVVQVGSFRFFHRRVFKMAPLHHHLELLGWPETTVMIRLWLLSGIAVAIAVALFYADFLSLGLN